VVARSIEDDWQIRAACRGPDRRLFFPPAEGERRDEREMREQRAKAICRTCAVRRDCLDYAFRLRDLFGIWGGLNENERRAMLAERAR